MSERDLPSATPPPQADNTLSAGAARPTADIGENAGTSHNADQVNHRNDGHERSAPDNGGLASKADTEQHADSRQANPTQYNAGTDDTIAVGQGSAISKSVLEAVAAMAIRRYLWRVLEVAVVAAVIVAVAVTIKHAIDQKRREQQQRVSELLESHHVHVQFWNGRAVQAMLAGVAPDHEILEHLKKLPFLERLVLMDVSISAEQWAELAGLRRMRELVVINVPVSSTALRELSNCQQLQYLKLSRATITDEHLPELCRLLSLERLDLTDNAITDKGILELARLPRLKEVLLAGNPLSSNGIQELLLASPHLIVHYPGMRVP